MHHGRHPPANNRISSGQRRENNHVNKTAVANTMRSRMNEQELRFSRARMCTVCMERERDCALRRLNWVSKAGDRIRSFTNGLKIYISTTTEGEKNEILHGKLNFPQSKFYGPRALSWKKSHGNQNSKRKNEIPLNSPIHSDAWELEK